MLVWSRLSNARRGLSVQRRIGALQRWRGDEGSHHSKANATLHSERARINATQPRARAIIMVLGEEFPGKILHKERGSRVCQLNL